MPLPEASIKQYETGSGNRILKGRTGTLYTGKKGSIIVAKAAVVGVDEHLWLALQLAVETVGICTVVNSIDTPGQHVPGSRHYVGCAVDMDMMGIDYTHLTAATVLNHHAVGLVKWLLAQGWKNHEGGGWPGCMLGPVHTQYNATGVSHVSHVHCSIQRPPGLLEEDAG
jgi:hypothetical protein